MGDKKPLRLLVVGYGKTEVTFINRLINRLAKLDAHITISSARRPHYQKFPPENVDWLWTPPWKDGAFLRVMRVFSLLIKGVHFKRFSWLVSQVKQAPTAFKKFLALHLYLPFARGQWDVIYFPWNSTSVDYLGLFDLDMPVVLSCRGSQINISPFLSGQQQYFELLKNTFEKASAVHCVSQDILSTAVALGLDPKKAVVIRPAVDPLFFSPGAVPYNNDPIQLITTGTLIWRKGYEYLLMALRKMKDRGISAELHIIGDGPERIRILFTANDLDLTSQVILHGKLSPTEVVDLLQQADIFVLSSLSEGISNAVLEAMSCGLPVVTTDCGGMREAIQEGVEGYKVPLRDPETMAEKLELLATNKDLRELLGTNARKRVLTDFSLDTQAKEFYQLFSSVNNLQQTGINKDLL